MSGKIENGKGGDCGGEKKVSVEERIMIIIQTGKEIIENTEEYYNKLHLQIRECDTQIDTINKNFEEMLRESKELNCMCSNVGSDVSRINNLLDRGNIQKSSTLRMHYFYGGHSEANSGIDEGDWSEY